MEAERRGHQPRMRTTLDGRVLEAADWNGGLALFRPTPWDHEPRPPFRVQGFRRWRGTLSLAVPQMFDTFDDAMSTAVTFLPPQLGATTQVIDETFALVFCVDATLERVVRYQRDIWLGTETAFRWLEESGRFDPSFLAMARIEAIADTIADAGLAEQEPT